MILILLAVALAQDPAPPVEEPCTPESLEKKIDDTIAAADELISTLNAIAAEKEAEVKPSLPKPEPEAAPAMVDAFVTVPQ